MSWFKATRDHVANLVGEMTGGERVSVSHFPRRLSFYFGAFSILPPGTNALVGHFALLFVSTALRTIRPFIPGCSVPTVPGYPEVSAVPNPGTRAHFVPGFGTDSNLLIFHYYYCLYTELKKA